MKLQKLLLSLFIITGSVGAFAQIGINTNSPDASSALDITATDKGLLIPRVTLTSDLNSPSPVTSPATGLLVFNTGANQTVGLYFWDGSKWNLFNAGSASTDYWNLSGNAGTSPGTNFLGTTDNQDLAVYTNNAERMRVMADGRVVIGATTPNYGTDLFSAIGNATQDWAINGYGNSCGVYGNGGSYGIYGSGGTYGLLGSVNSSSSYAVRGDNQDANGWGGIFAGSGQTPSILTGRSAGLSSKGSDGVFASGAGSSGIGIIAGGNGVSTFSTIATGTGGAFTGFHGLYGKAIDPGTGIGVIGVGNNGTTYYTTTTGTGGAFSGVDGLYAYATNTSGFGVIGVSYGASTYISISNGSGGSFTGYHGIITKAVNNSGTGVIGIGSNRSSYYLYSNGSGGAFTGYRCGVAGYAVRKNSATIGVYGYYAGGTSSADGTGVKGVAVAASGWGYGVYGQGNYYGVYANGNLGASGTKSFVIDDPRDPENKILKHYTIESNEVLNMYRGVVQLNSNGEAEVTLPDYFTTININYSYTLTSIGMPAPSLYIKEEIDSNGRFKIAGGNPVQKVSWVVYAERNDPYMQKYRDREVDVIDKKENEKGKYIMPELYNQPPEKGMFYSGEPKEIRIDEKPVIRKKTAETKKSEIENIDSKVTNKK